MRRFFLRKSPKYRIVGRFGPKLTQLFIIYAPRGRRISVSEHVRPLRTPYVYHRRARRSSRTRHWRELAALAFNIWLVAINNYLFKCKGDLKTIVSKDIKLLDYVVIKNVSILPSFVVKKTVNSLRNTINVEELFLLLK